MFDTAGCKKRSKATNNNHFFHSISYVLEFSKLIKAVLKNKSKIGLFSAEIFPCASVLIKE